MRYIKRIFDMTWLAWKANINLSIVALNTKYPSKAPFGYEFYIMKDRSGNAIIIIKFKSFDLFHIPTLAKIQHLVYSTAHAIITNLLPLLFETSWYNFICVGDFMGQT